MALDHEPIPLFQPGRLLITAGVAELYLECKLDPLEYLWRHLQGDAGFASDPKYRLAFDAMRADGRRLSAYFVDAGIVLLIVTAADGSTTNILLAEEYLNG